MVVVGKGFRASTVWASKPGKIGHPTLALKTDEHEWRATFWTNRLITGRQRIKQKVFNSAHNRTFEGERDAFAPINSLANELQLD